MLIILKWRGVNVFENDLEFAESSEEKIWLSLLKSDKTKDVIDVRSDKFFQELDIDFLQVTYKGNVNKIEVKCDRKADETGNMVYEVTSSGNPGCMKRTRADYVYYVLNESGKTYALLVEPLKIAVESMDFKKQFSLVKMGDNAEGYVIPLNWLVKRGVAKEVTNG